MIYNFLGVVGVQNDGEVLVFESEESRAEYSSGEFKLRPAARDYLRLSLHGKSVFKTYKRSEVRVFAPGSQWSSSHHFLGGTESYLLFNENDEQDLYVARRWSGEVLFQLPYFSAERYFSPGLIALGDKHLWSLYDLNGLKVNEVVCSALSGRSGQARFTDRLFLFRVDSEPNYRIYDIEKRELVSSVSVVDCVFAMLAPPGSNTWLVDAEGVKRFGNYDKPHTTLEMIHRFSTPLDADQNDVLIWHDLTRVYVASSLARDRQLLLAIPLDGKGPVEELNWTQTWSITRRGGCLNGYNYLTLGRSDLLADNAVIVWADGQLLSEELVRVDLSPVIEVKEVSSAIKAKHGFHIRVEDSSNNRAIRSAAHEIGRLIAASCSGAYNHALEIIDRKFDGQFYIEFNTPIEPDDFERGFLSAYIHFFRDSGGLSPAGSKAPLAEPIITWNIVIA